MGSSESVSTTNQARGFEPPARSEGLCSKIHYCTSCNGCFGVCDELHLVYRLRQSADGVAGPDPRATADMKKVPAWKKATELVRELSSPTWSRALSYNLEWLTGRPRVQLGSLAVVRICFHDPCWAPCVETTCHGTHRHIHA